MTAADAPANERNAPRMLFALSWVISENKLTTPKSTMNVIAADIRLFFSPIFTTSQHTSFNFAFFPRFSSSLFDFDLMTSHTPEKTRMTATP